MKKLSKEERQQLLKHRIYKNPFLTDRELAEHFNVSIQTIRLDRMELKIPELRQRTKEVAQSAYKNLKSVNSGDIIGELIELNLEERAESILITTDNMAFKNGEIIRGHVIFAQANSLAVSVIDTREVLTGSASIRYHKRVFVNDKLHSTATLINRKDHKYTVEIKTYREEELVFSGEFIMFSMAERDDSE